MTTTAKADSAPHVRASPAAPRARRPRMALHRRMPETFRRDLLLGTARVVGLIIGDVSCLFLLLAVVRALRAEAVLGPTLGGWATWVVLTATLRTWQYPLALVIGLAFAGAYARGSARRDLWRVFSGVSLGSGLALWEKLWTVGAVPFVIGAAGATVLLWIVIALERRVLNRVVTWVFPPRREPPRTLFVGDPAHAGAARVFRHLVLREQMLPVGWLSSNGTARSGVVLGGTGDVWSVLARVPVDTVVLCGWLPNDGFGPVVEAASAAGCRVLAVSHCDEAGGLHPGLVAQSGVSFVELTMPSLRARQLFVKRVVDVALAGLGLIVLAPVLALVAAAIKRDSPGPVFFTQDRVGLGGRTFRFVKFRTMRDGADAEKAGLAHLNHTGDSRLFKIVRDPRVTRLGAWLRRWSIDELPQLWNVFAGHMSLVGPRPFFETDLASYDEHHFTRLGAKPGITGLWQVNGRSDVLDFEEVVRLDREYIDRWSLWLDVKIMVQTLPAVLRRTGAY